MRDGLHPIAALTAQAERKWKDLLARQSVTLEQAVKQYRIRYDRDPPKGFDDWQVEFPLVLPEIAPLLAPFFPQLHV